MSTAHARDVKSEDILPKSIYNSPWVAPNWDAARRASCNSPTLPKEVAPTRVPPFWVGWLLKLPNLGLSRASRPRSCNRRKCTELAETTAGCRPERTQVRSFDFKKTRFSPVLRFAPHLLGKRPSSSSFVLVQMSNPSISNECSRRSRSEL